MRPRSTSAALTWCGILSPSRRTLAFAANAPFSDDTPATHSLVTQLGSGTEKTK